MKSLKLSDDNKISNTKPVRQFYISKAMQTAERNIINGFYEKEIFYPDCFTIKGENIACICISYDLKKVKLGLKKLKNKIIKTEKAPKWKSDKNKTVTINGKTTYGVGESIKDIIAFGKQYGVKPSDLTSDELKFIKLYSKEGFKFLNDYLRTGKNKQYYKKQWNKKLKTKDYFLDFDKAIETGNNIFKKGMVLEEDIVIVRRQKTSLLKYSKNNIYTSDAYLSTTISINVDPKKYGEYINLIRIPKGTKILYIEQVTSTPKDYEVLLKPGTQLELVNKQSKKLLEWNLIK